MLTFGERGDRLVHLERVDQDAERFGPITHALVLLSVPGGVVLVHNRQRDCWELPGGLRDAGESPAECASRELREETGIGPVAVRLVAVMTLDLRPSPRKPFRREECGAVFLAEHPAVPVPFESPEISAVIARPADRLPARTGELDRHLVRELWPGTER
ncbi:ADP-ribose pyrophosphatase YjhB, NUDIX family [Lentzea fradiae]|uniref:ADP-ribose pyrophosphatase YjhB, NUDIX family n=1 Tax=Lentzea fradiae TaxID=200378 RepID=A0A1G8BH20_9PSEU|nr:NUDIX domain-containing protein [Lentzea fradiae]SDH32313.1 ADP-ribose pyrophosphatase YjhB, NUDIX family [Lentzea fradiae]